MAYKPHCKETLIPIILEHLRNGATKRAAVQSCGVSHETLYRWLEEDVTLCDDIQSAEAEAELHYQSTIHNHARTDWKPAAWWLERRRKGDYGPSIDLKQIPVDKLLELRQALLGDSTDTDILTAQSLKRIQSDAIEVLPIPVSVLSEEDPTA